MGQTRSTTWLVVEPSEGTGQGRLNYTAREVNNGRNPRTKVSEVTGDGGDVCDVTATQHGRPLYVHFDPNQYSTSNSGGQVVITGHTNALSLTFAESSDTDNILTIDSSGYKASTDGGATWSGSYITNGNGPANDPGGTQDWMFMIVATVASTTGTTDSVARLRVTASDGVGTQATSASGTNPDATITRHGADGFTQIGTKAVGPWSNDVQIYLGWQEGSTSEVYVNSNEHWEVTIDG